MKKNNFLLLLILVSLQLRRKITRELLWVFCKVLPAINWQQLHNKYEAAQILEEEMKIAGFEWISTFRLIKISDGEYYCNLFFPKSKVGSIWRK
jgi:hypothetical protein